VEPEDGPILPADFEGLAGRAQELYDQDPDSKLEIADARFHERRQRQTWDRALGAAIAEAIERKLGRDTRFFAALPTLVGEYRVFTLVGLSRSVLDGTPRLSSEFADGRYKVTQSLVAGVIDELLVVSGRDLHEPDAGINLSLSVPPTDIVRAAGAALTLSAIFLAGSPLMAPAVFEGMNRVATTRYERRVGVGSLLLADRRSDHVERLMTLKKPVRLGETRTLRKLLETSSRTGGSLLTDGAEVYGLGRLKHSYPTTSETVFHVLVVGDGTWELHHANLPLATVQYGVPRLPERRLRRERLDDIAARVFDDYDSDALWILATAAADAEHGTMVVVSQGAAEEATRLSSQAITLEPTMLDDVLVRQVTGIDGAVLVDPSGYCHAIGVILDGTATSDGDRARGARYNSAVKYLARTENERTLILLVSEDGMINILPNLRPRIPWWWPTASPTTKAGPIPSVLMRLGLLLPAWPSQEPAPMHASRSCSRTCS
jgi:hypothetical protein